MRKRLLLLIVLLTVSSIHAQNTSEFILQVLADSAFIRAAPDKEAPEVASVFENDSLTAVGRNIDGLWLEVRRPGRKDAAGWISREVALFTFEVAKLPITDLTTGLTGPEPVVDTGISVLMVGEAKLRTGADQDSAEITVIPVNLTLPVLERTPDRLWLKVNYRGTVGWVAEFLTSTSADIRDVMVSPEYALTNLGAFEIIPPEIQIAQIDRLTVWIAEMDAIARDVSTYWTLMSKGETMECRPPAGDYAYYAYTPRDIAELPELRRQVRILQQAIDDLNSAIATMKRCGVYLDKEIRAAYADAINAQTIFGVVTRQMGNLKERIETYGS
jgi:uncharacterized protein YraI